MKLLFWLSPLFTGTAPVEETQLEDLDIMPRSERCPTYARQSDMPVDHMAAVERERALYACRLF